MGEYFIGSDGELYHWGWKKKDAKYIKRERKNGKWVYTYPQDKTKKIGTLYDIAKANEAKKKLGQGGSGATRYDIAKTNEAKKKEAEKAAREAKRQQKISELKNVIKDKLGYDEKEKYEKAQKVRENVENTHKKVEDRFNKIWEEWDDEAKGKKWFEDPYAAESFRKIDRWGNVSNLAKKQEEQARKDFLSTPLGILTSPKEALNNAVEEFKDYLGYDEKAKREEARRSLNAYDKMIDKSQERLKSEIDFSTKWDMDDFNHDYIKAEVTWLRLTMEGRVESAKEYMKAQEEFSKTPIGKIYGFNERVKAGADVVGDWFKDIVTNDKKEKAKAQQERYERMTRDMEELYYNQWRLKNPKNKR